MKFVLLTTLLLLSGCALVSPNPSYVINSSKCEAGVGVVETTDKFESAWVLLNRSSRTTKVECR